MDYFFNFDKISYFRNKKTTGCILCLIACQSEEVEKLVVYRTSNFNISVNLYPYNPGHLILFPIRHILDIRELSPTEQKEMNALLLKCLDVLDETHHPSGFNFGCNMGPVAGASIAHFHYHIIPRYPHETGIVELISNHRFLAEDPRVTHRILSEKFLELE